MKRFYKFLMPLVAIVAMALPWNVQAQSLTVANGTATSTYIPFYGTWMDADQHNQVLYPSSMISGMAENYITSMTFYMTSPNTTAWNADVIIRMKEVTDSVLTALYSDTTGFVTVWTGTVNGLTAQMPFYLDVPFAYEGGNLLVDITTEAATYNAGTFGGVSHAGGSFYSYNTTTSVESFLPKTTFTYNATGSICLPPSNFSFTFSEGYANFTWADTVGTTWEFVYGASGFDPDGIEMIPFSETSTSYALDTTNFTPGYYDAYVRTNCGDDNSAWVGPLTFGVGITDYMMAVTGTDTLRTCNATIYDDGGADGQYSANCQSTLVILPSTEGAFVNITGSSYTEGTWDYLRIYDGIGTDGELLFDDYGVSTNQNFGPFQTEAVTVVFHSDGSIFYNGFEINVSCLMPSDCARPTAFEVTGVGSDSVYFEWADEEGSEWVIAYGLTGFNMGGESTSYANFTETSGAIGGLTPNTTYDFYLMTLCGADTSWPRMVTVRTSCVFIDSLPYTNSFEDASTGTSTSFEFGDPCFTLLTDATQYPYVYVGGSSYAHTGSQGIYWYRSSSTGSYGTYQALVLPGVNADEEHPITSMQVKFWAKNSSSSYNAIFHVGVMTNPNDISTFTELGVINTNGSTEWTEYVVALGDYTGTGNYVAIRSNVGNYWYAYVDDITLEYAPVCPPITAINVEGVTTSGAYLTWEYQPGLAGTPEEYEIEYVNVDDPDATAVAATTTDPYIFLTGLQSSTHYMFKVRVNCGDDGVTSWDSTIFSTVGFGCAVIDETAVDSVIFSNSTSGISGCLAYSSWGNTVYQAVYTAEELIAAGLSAGPITGIDLGFTASSSYAKEFTIFMGNSQTTYINNAVIENPQTQVYGPVDHPTGTEGWQHYDFTTPFVWDGSSSILLTTFMNQPTGTSHTSSSGLTGYYVSANNKARFRYRDSQQWTTSNLTEGSAGSDYSYRASIHFHTLGCAQPATCSAPAAGVMSVDSTSATVAWTPGADETSWDTYYRLDGDSVWTSAANGVTATTYTFTGLNPGTDYEFRIVNNCTEGEFATTISATTACALFNLPLTEDFESVDFGVFEPACWINGSTHLGTSYPYPQVVSLTGDPNKLLIFYNGGYLILPRVNAPLNQLQVRFKFVQGGTDVRFLMGLMPSQDAPINSMIVLDTLIRSDIDTASSTVYVTIPLNDIDAEYNNYHLAFWDAFNDNYSFIDDLVIEYIPQCAPVSDLTATANENSAELNWTAAATATSYIVEYGPHRFTPGTGTTVAVTGTSTTLAGLNHSTTYDVYVYTVCEGNDTSNTGAMAEFTTNCAPFTTLPYSMSFENIVPPGTSSSTVIMPNCWGTEATTGGTAPSIYYTTTTAYAPSQAYCLYFYNLGVAALPEMSMPLNTLMLSFHAYNATPNLYGLVIGAVDSIAPGYAASFEPIDTIVFEYGNNNEYNVTSFLNGYTGNANRIAIKNFNYDSTSSYSTIYIDDLVVSAIPSCIAPQRVHTTSLTNVSADLAWTISNGSSYNVEYGPHGFTPGTGTTVTSTTQSMSLTGLTPYTQYDVRLVSICSATDHSDTTLYTFTTLRAAPVNTLPYFCDFSDSTMSAGWELLGTATLNWAVGSATNNGPDGGQSLYVSTDNGATNTYNISSAAPAIYTSRAFVLAADNYNFSFDWKADGESTWDYLRAYLVPTDIQLNVGIAPNGGTSSNGNNAAAPMPGWIALGEKLNQQSSWQSYSEDLTIVNPGTYNLVFYWGNDGSGGTQPPAAVDNISVSRNVCAITDLQVDSVDGNSVTISWTGSSESYDVEYGNVGFVHGSGLMRTTTATSITLTGLSSLTNYDVYVRGICNGAADTSRWYHLVAGTGICTNATIVQNWDTSMTVTTSSYSPIGYSFYNYSYTQTIIDSAMMAEMDGDITAFAYYAAATTAGDKFNNMDVYMANVSESDLSSGFIMPDSAHTFVQVLTDANLCFTTTGEHLVSLDAPFTWDGHSNVLFVVNRKNGTYSSGASFEAHEQSGDKMRYIYNDGSAYSISTVSGGYTSSTVGDIKFFSCGVGVCVAPEIDTLYAGETDVTINWTGFADSYEVAIIPGTWSEPTSVMTVIGNTHTFIGLTPGTQYAVGVRAVCSEELQSEWAVMNITTAEHPCYAPSAVTMTANSISSVTIGWTPAEASQTQFEIRYSVAGDTSYVTVSTNPYEITGLVNGTAYSVAVRAICGEGNYSDWSAPITATTADCGGVTDVRVAPATTTAVVTWTSNATTFELEYGIYGTSRGQGTRVTVTGTTYTIEGLEPETNYQVTVRTKCSETAYSDWSPVLPFETDEAQGIDDVDNAAISLYPNPASSTVTLTGIEGEATVVVVDMNGRQVYSGNAANGSLTIDVSGMAQGAYFVRITGERVNAIRKLIVR